jgi:hypothetical protein
MLDQLLHVGRLHIGTPSRPERDVRVEAHCHNRQFDPMSRTNNATWFDRGD